MRRPKLEAVREAMTLIVPRLHGDTPYDVLGIDAPSGVGHTPLSREEIMAGARQRAEALVRTARQENRRWNYFAGLEGGSTFCPKRKTLGFSRELGLRHRWQRPLIIWPVRSNRAAGRARRARCGKRRRTLRSN